MAKKKQIENLLFKVYNEGLQMQDCNLTDYYERIMKILNIPIVSKSAKHKSKIDVNDPEAPWNWRKDKSEI